MHKWFTTHAACLLNCTKSLSCVVIRVFGLSSLCRDTYVPDGAQGFYTTHTQYINVENNVDTSVERGAFSIQWGCWFVFIVRILDTPFRMFHREFTYIGIVILIALSKLSQHNMHGQGPCDKRTLLSCPILYQLRGHPTASSAAMGLVWVTSTVTPTCRMAPNVFTKPIYNTLTENMCSIQNHIRFG